MLQTQFRLKHFCSVLHLFVYRFEVWCYPKHYNQCKRGVEPLGTLLRNTLFSLQVPFVKQVAVYLKYVFVNCHFICCTVFRALLVTTGKVLPKKRAFYNRDFKRSTSRSKNFPFFKTYKFSLEKGKFFATILPKRSKYSFNPAFLAILCCAMFFFNIVI